MLFLLSCLTLNLLPVQSSTHDAECLSKICRKEANYFQELLDPTVNPCDNFYKFTCSKSRIPSVISLEGEHYWKTQMIDKIHEKLERHVKEDLENLRADDTSYLKKLEIFYDNCKKNSEDENKRSLLEILKHVGGMPVLLGKNWNSDEFDWLDMVYRLRNHGFSPKLPVNFSIWSRGHGGDEYGLAVKPSKFRNYCALDKMVELVVKFGANEEIARKEMQEVCDFEEKLHDMTRIPDTTRDLSIRILNSERKYNYIPWLKLFRAHFVHSNIIINEDFMMDFRKADFFENLKDVIKRTPKRVLANYLTWDAMNEIVQFLNDRFNLIKLKKLTKDSERQAVCAQIVTEFFPRAVEAMYVQNHITLGARETANNLTEGIKNELIKYIRKAEWIENVVDDGTIIHDNKETIVEKVEQMKYLLGYPTEYLDNQVLVEYHKIFNVEYESFLRTALKTMKFLEGIEGNKLKKNNHARAWDKLRDGTNPAHYFSYYKNYFELPFIYLHDEFVHSEKPQYLNYGNLGSTIAKYFAHAVDNLGFDRDAKFSIIYHTGATNQQMADKTKCLINQYNNYLIEQVGLRVDGDKTLIMNMVDNIGFKIAYQAYVDWANRNNVSEPRLPGINYTPRQMFWISAASFYCGDFDSKNLELYMMDDKYLESPAEARVMASFSNLKEFAEDFQCKPGSRMNPIKKCDIL